MDEGLELMRATAPAEHAERVHIQIFGGTTGVVQGTHPV